MFFSIIIKAEKKQKKAEKSRKKSRKKFYKNLCVCWRVKKKYFFLEN